MGHSMSIWGPPHIDSSNMGTDVMSIWEMPHIDIANMGWIPYQQINMGIQYGAFDVNMGCVPY